MQLGTALETVQGEISQALSTVDPGEVDALISTLLAARRVFVISAGRVGLAGQGFAMRLMHLGLNAHWLGDVTTPSVGPGDLLLVLSGSGETEPVRVLTRMAVQRGADVATITRQPQATVGALSKTVVRLMPCNEDGSEGVHSVQPMTSLFEQSVSLLLDGVVLLMMDRMNETDATMRQRHYNLER